MKHPSNDNSSEHALFLPQMCHWASPQFLGYAPQQASFPSLLGEWIADAINAVGFTWASSPAGSELEVLGTVH